MKKHTDTQIVTVKAPPPALADWAATTGVSVWKQSKAALFR